MVSLEDAFASTADHWMLNLVDLGSPAGSSVDLPAGYHYPSDRRGRVLRWTGDGSGLSIIHYTGRGHLPFVHRHLRFDGTLGATVGPADATSYD